MNLSPEQLEWIVSEVVRRLTAALQSSGQSPASPATAELVLTDKLVTLRTLEGRLAGVKQIVVPPRAIVTPAVRDELKQRGIKLVR